VLFLSQQAGLEHVARLIKLLFLNFRTPNALIFFSCGHTTNILSYPLTS